MTAGIRQRSGNNRAMRVTNGQLLDAMLKFQEAFLLAFKNVDKRFDALERRFDRMESRDVDRRLYRLERQVAAIESRA